MDKTLQEMLLIHSVCQRKKKNRSLGYREKCEREKRTGFRNRSGSMYSGGGCSDGWNCGREDISVCYVFEKGSDACGISDIRQCR